MSNFAFLPPEFRPVAEAASKAESHILGDPRAACFHARFALEAVIHWLYRHDPALRMPYDQSLGALLHEPTFQNLLPEAVFQKARVIQKVGNLAVHSQRPIRQFDALQTVKELHHFCHWLVRTYAPDAPREGAAWKDERVPAAASGAGLVPRQELEDRERRLTEQNEAALKQQQERDALDAEPQALRAQLAEIRAAAEQTPDTHDYTEAETRRYLFDLEQGVPTDAYELTEAVRDGFLVPPRAQQVDLRFPREGIDYHSLSDEEKVQWESLDWGDETTPETLPNRVNAAAINNWLFNRDTVDKVLQHLMEHGHKVEGGDRLAKTIIFARNHDHAKFIEERFNHHYPQYAGHFARVIDNQAKYPQSLIDDFSIKDKAPHIAISVDMLDTGIDVPEVANLVFFKPVYSRIKFWQMIGRGTRLCPDLFGPGQDKEDFRVFDFCFNFDFFRENPEGINSPDSAPLGTRLFRARVQLLGHLQAAADLDPDRTLYGSLAEGLHREVGAMNPENFIVRMHWETVERFQDRGIWERLDEDDRAALQQEVAGLPTALATDDIESRLFDLTALRMQLAHAEGDDAGFERHRARVVEIAMLLEDKSAIPAVAAQLGYLAAIQETTFWDGIGLAGLEEMRLRLRGLVPFLDKERRQVVYTDFKDEVLGIREEIAVHVPKMTGAQYAKKVNDYLRSHLDDLAIHRLRMNEPLTIWGVMEASALYEPPFSNLHAGGPDELFSGKEIVIEGIFDALQSIAPRLQAG